MKKTLKNYLNNKKLVYISVATIAILILILFLFRNSNSSIETDIASIGNVTEKINVTGKVAPLKKAELGFEKGGTVSKINFKVGDIIKTGDTIIALDSLDALADLKGAEANYLAEQTRLYEIEKGLRPEELSVEEAKLKSANISFEDARTTLVNALHDSYVKTENSIFNYMDSFFTNSQTVVPRINIRTENYNQENSINNRRIIVGENLRAWKASLDGMTLSTTTDPVSYLNNIHKYLENIKVFMSTLSSLVADLTTGNSGLSQTTIDSYNVTINSGLSTFNIAIASLAGAESTYRSALSNLNLATDQFNLKKAGSSEETIGAQIAKADQANANLLAYKTEYNKKRLVSPIDGIITKIVPELGEFINAGQIVSVIMSDSFKIEVNIPEADIAKILIGNSASVTLDAYDNSVIFYAHVTAIDPAETIIEGVPTYKVTLEFDEKDERIRSGMTANIDIITNQKDSVITVPYRAIINKKGIKYVRVVNGSNSKNYTEIKVQIGIRGDNGRVEIVSGLNGDEKVITLIK